MIQTARGTFIFMSVLVGSFHVQAAENSSNIPIAIEAHEEQRTGQPASTTRMTPQSLSAHGGALQQSAAPNCEGEAPSATAVTALLSRIVRSSVTIRGVQCPIPAVHDFMPTQETHP